MTDVCYIDDNPARTSEIVDLLVRADVRYTHYDHVQGYPECCRREAPFLILCHAHPQEPEQRLAVGHFLSTIVPSVPVILISGSWADNRSVDASAIRELARGRDEKLTRGFGTVDLYQYLVAFLHEWRRREWKTAVVPWDIILAGDPQRKQLRTWFAGLMDVITAYLRLHDANQGRDATRASQAAWDKCRFESPNNQRIFRPVALRARRGRAEARRAEDQGWFLFDAHIEAVNAASYSELEEQQRVLSGCNSLRVLWNAVRGYCLGHSDGIVLDDSGRWNQVAVTNLFREAFREYKKLLACKDLDALRSQLRHNLLKMFACKVLDGAPDSPVEERMGTLLCFFDEHRRAKLDADGCWESKRRIVLTALEQWREQRIGAQLGEFFERAQRDYGFELTDKGSELFTQLFAGPCCSVAVIDEFARTFPDRLRNASDISDVEQALRGLVTALGELDGGFRKMAHRDEDGLFFSGCFQ